VNQPIYQQLDSKTIEALKAARNQVTPADPAPEQVRYGAGKSGHEDKNANPVRDKTPEAFAQPLAGISNGVNRGQNLNPTQVQFGARNKFAPLAPLRDLSLTGFAEEFVQKLVSIEREKAAVDEEMAKVEKLWSGLVEKKKQLEARRNELTKVKDKLNELDKEMNDVLGK